MGHAVGPPEREDSFATRSNLKFAGAEAAGSLLDASRPGYGLRGRSAVASEGENRRGPSRQELAPPLATGPPFRPAPPLPSPYHHPLPCTRAPPPQPLPFLSSRAR